MQLEADAKPELSAHPGYLRIVAPLGTEQPLNCFVYDEPLDSGQALTRLLRAMEDGIAFERFEVRGISVEGDAPILFLHAHYRRTDSAGRNGLVKLALSPRVPFPVMCSHEEPRLIDSFERVVTGLLASMEPRPTFARAGLGAEDRPVVVETWILEKDGKPIGYSQWRVAELPNEQTHSLVVTSTFVPEGDRLRTTDSVVVEVEDERGLLKGNWLEIVGTDPVIQLEIRRTEAKDGAFAFEARGRAKLEEIGTRFTSDQPLRSSVGSYRALEVLRDRGEGAVDFLQYLPHQALDGPVAVSVKRTSSGSATVRRGPVTQALSLGDDGLPQTVGGRMDARLMFRRVFDEAENVGDEEPE